MLIETKRLVLKPLCTNDFNNLKTLLQDEKVMYAYEHIFSDEECETWFSTQLERYKEEGYGLLGVFLKEDNTFIGQASITKQNLNGNMVDEIGYLLKKEYWKKGYAIECAKALKTYGFDILNLDKIYSIIRDNNISSQNVAKKNNMKKTITILKHYYNLDMPHYVYCITKDEFLKERI
ncbi:GNAT family N-acetyltransferase [[Clostridium] colinum]|uniref:GNAT family N-acetyltransferase n=1 Tax=[Clostridium] colinum TaxID=36835 RepID=UPI002024F65C|nr:GNAT family N-acetyltransferase [[Clostridium] colinum]